MAKTLLAILVFVFLGTVAGQNVPKLWSLIKQYVVPENALYVTADDKLISLAQSSQVQQIGWRQLLPQLEQQLLEKYQAPRDEGFSEQLTRSIEASKDKGYLDAMYSSNIVEGMQGRLVSISGFIVPVELGEGRTVNRFFLVPYYGACIHYPPPPPNQILYLSIEEGIAVPDLTEPFTVTGLLKVGLYEDLIGTAAYQMDLIRIDEFHGQPDDFREH